MNSTGLILLVEDEAHDVEFLQRAFKRVGVANPIRAVGNGEEAIAYLSGAGAFSDRAAHPYPGVIITDLKMPQMGGLELLGWLAANPKSRLVPTIVFTSSTSQADIDAAFAAGAAGYFVKPVAFEQLERVTRVIAEYWRTSLVPTAAV